MRISVTYYAMTYVMIEREAQPEGFLGYLETVACVGVANEGLLLLLI